jgi:rSAM/selenodomain-associated transferase 1
VKTRLATATSPEWAARVAEAFLHDILDRLGAIDARRLLVFAPPAAVNYFTPLTRGRFDVLPQKGGDLGQRMSNFIGDELAAGAPAVVVVGADSPTLPGVLVEQAFRELDSADLVLGPATDGGYYLVGCARRVAPIFEGVAWSGCWVLAETISRLKDPAWRLAVLPPWYDVDTLDDWRMLCGHLAALRRAGIDPGTPRTESLCQSPVP